MKLIINNNFLISMPKKQHAHLKSIVVSDKEFSSINQHIRTRYSEIKPIECNFNIFYSWSLLAMIMGILAGHSDRESTKLFLKCLSYNYLPKISVVKIKKEQSVRICVCILDKELNERKTKFENTRQ